MESFPVDQSAKLSNMPLLMTSFTLQPDAGDIKRHHLMQTEGKERVVDKVIRIYVIYRQTPLTF